MPTYEFMCEACKKTFDIVLTTAERATAKVQCPGCGSSKVEPRVAMFSAKTSRKS
jgi:putative FmdB family regulatory protein